MIKSDNTFLPDFSHIYVESDAKKYNLTRECLDRFSKAASKEVESALKLMLIDEAKGIILDLRNNPGGLLHEAVKIVKDEIKEEIKEDIHDILEKIIEAKKIGR